MTLTEFLLARIAEDETAARAAVWCNQAHWSATERTYLCSPDGYEAHVRVGTDEVGTYVAEQILAEWAEHMARHDPARVLAECAAKRRIAKEHERVDWHVNVNSDLPHGTPICGTCGDTEWYAVAWPCATLRALTLPYADHPDYREEWRP